MEAQGSIWIECLLGEDNPGDVRLVREALRELPLPIRLHVVADGEQVLAFLQQHGAYAAAPLPDLVILDLSLPKRRGEEVLAVLKGDPVLHSIPVFIALEFAGERFLVRSQGLPSRSLSAQTHYRPAALARLTPQETACSAVERRRVLKIIH